MKRLFLLFLTIQLFALKVEEKEVLKLNCVTSDTDLHCDGELQPSEGGVITLRIVSLLGCGIIRAQKVALSVVSNTFSGKIICEKSFEFEDRSMLKPELTTYGAGEFQFTNGQLIKRLDIHQ